MKKKVITLSCIAAVAIATFIGTKTLQSNAQENGLLAQNVEALSRPEGGKWVKCWSGYSYHPGYQIRYCGTCELVPGTRAFLSYQSECKL